MNIRINVLLGLLLLFVCSCSDDNEEIVVSPDGEGVFVDDKGNEYPYVRYGDLEWMTENLSVRVADGCEVIHEENRNPIDKELEITRNLQTFGRIYTYSAALKAVPKGWRLPTDEDWQKLERALGMSDTDVKKMEWRGAPVGALLQQNESALCFRNGGMGEMDYIYGLEVYFPYVYGFYWTSTPETENNQMMFCRQISYKSDAVARILVDKNKMLSVRCVRDVE
ncbi:MAG: fibrobacter succinogenes major paralogous domain-containing protein [Odoribacter splanchnicus]